MIQNTSRDALADLYKKGKVGLRQYEVLQIIAKGDITDREIHLQMQREHPQMQVAHVTPRRGELVKLGMVETTGKRKCSVTGKRVIAWCIRDTEVGTQGRLAL